MKEFNQKLQERFAQMQQSGRLFRVALTGQQVWDLYLTSFGPEADPVFRDPNSTTHNCNLCNNFIRRYGNVVSISPDYGIMTMFDVLTTVEYQPSANAITKAIKKSHITEVFFETFAELQSLPYEACKKSNAQFQLGVDKNVKRYDREEAAKYPGVVEYNETRTFNHLHLFLNKEFVDQSGRSVEAIMGEYRDAKNVFKRAMDEISLDTLHLVRDLIIQGSLLDGTTHLYKLDAIIPLKAEYDNLAAKDRDNWCWVRSYGFALAKFRNELLGVLCVELTEGEELNKAVQAWNKRVDPANYMKAVAPITKAQIELAKKFVEENGYEASFNRRFATIDDIKASEIFHINVGDGKIKNASIFDAVKPAISTRHKRSEFDAVEEVTIDKFMNDILPNVTSVEAFLTNQQEGNLVSLTTAATNDSKPIFKWPNNYSWTYNGNLAGKSQIKQAVKDAGGNVEGVLNFRLAWNESGQDNSDLDLWATEASGQQIGFSTSYRKDRGSNYRSSNSGQLDVDIISPNGKLAVENITWTDASKMTDGVYKVWVNPFSRRNSQGFKMEIEFDGETYVYSYDKSVSGNVHVAEVTLKNGEFSIKHILPATEGAGVSKEIYGLETNKFHKVNLVSVSPNHWDGNNVGNKHYFLMLEGAKTPAPIRSFHNENLIPELAQHRKVLEVLGAQTMLEPAERQLAGLGFNATVRDEVVLRIKGSHQRVIKVKF